MKPTQRFFRHIFAAGILTFTATAVIILTGCDVNNNGRNKQSAGASGAPSEVEVTEVRLQDVAFSRMITGRTAACVLAEVRPQVSGIIKKRLFEEGAEVKAGDVLYLIDDALYKAAYESAKASLNKAETNERLLRVKRERFKAMLERKAISQQDFDDVDASYQAACAEKRVQKAKAEEARIELEYTRIKAPVSGRTGLSRVTEGALVTQHQAAMLTCVQQLDPIYVTFSMSASELSVLRRKAALGQMAENSFGRVRLFFDDGTPYNREGVVDFSDVSVNAQTGSVTLRATLENSENLLMPNMAIRAELVEGIAANAILVPQPAVTLHKDGTASIFVLGRDNRAEERKLEILGSKGKFWHVGAGLVPGERIITNGFRYVRSGMTVTPSASAEGKK